MFDSTFIFVPAKYTCNNKEKHEGKIHTWFSTSDHEYYAYKLLPLSKRLEMSWVVTPTCALPESMLSMICSVQLTPSGEEHLSSMIRYAADFDIVFQQEQLF